MIRTPLMLFCLTSPLILAQTVQETTVFQQPLSQRNKATFQGIGQRLRATPVLRAQFRQNKQIKVLRRPLHSSGSFLFAAEQGVWWHTTQPFVSTFVITKKGILQQSEGHEPQIIEATEQPIIAGFTRVFMSLFGGDTTALEKQFELFFSGDLEQWTIGLRPKHKIMSKLIKSIVLQGGLHIKTIDFRERTGDHTHIVLQEVRIQPGELTAEERRRFAY